MNQPDLAAYTDLAFTLICSDTPLTKLFRDEDGKIVKTPTGKMITGLSTRKSYSLKVITDSYLANECVSEAIVLGNHAIDLPYSMNIVTADALKQSKNKDCIARTKDYFHFVDGPGLVLLDYDPCKHASKQLNVEELWSILTEACAGFADVAHVIKRSVSSSVRYKDQDDSDVLGGVHIYLAAKQQSDYPRFTEVLFKRLILQGHGYIAISAAGTLLLRTYIDKTVASPERLIFEAPPIIQSESLTFTPALPDYYSGELLDTTLLHDLTEVEELDLSRIFDMLKASKQSEALIVRAAWMESRIEAQVLRGEDRETVRRQLEARGIGPFDLYGKEEIVFANGNLGRVCVDSVLDNPKKYEGQACADPNEGIDYGKTTAKFFANDGKPCINSYAHGGSVYFLHRELATDLTAGVNATGESLLLRYGKGNIPSTLVNVSSVLSDYVFTGSCISYDTYRDELMIASFDELGSRGGWQPFIDADYTSLRIRLAMLGFRPVPRDIIRDAVAWLGRECQFDSAIEWLNGQEWKGHCRCETFLMDYFSCVDTPYIRAMGLYIWTALAGRILNPGIKADMVPILVGEQGCGKSTGVKAMAPFEDQFCEINLGSKDEEIVRSMKGKSMVELSELRGLAGREAEAGNCQCSCRLDG
jgi:Virulence-associated protein E